MVAPFQIPGLPTYPTSFPYPPSLAQPFMVGGTTSPFPSSAIGARIPSYTQGLMTPAELGSRVAGIQSMVTPATIAESAGGTVAPGLISRLVPSFLTREATPEYLAMSGLSKAGAIGKGMLSLKGLGYGLAGEAGSLAAKKLLPGSGMLEHAVSGGSLGAGSGAALGATIGALGGPIGAGGGALIGGGLGILGGLLFGGNKKKAADRPIDTLRDALTAVNLSPADQHQYIKYYSVLNSIGGDTPESRAQSAATVKQVILQQFLAQQQQPNRGMPYTPQEQAALQAQTAAFLAPYRDSSINTTRQSVAAQRAQLANVPAAYRGVLEASISQQEAASIRLANAYAAQALLAPQASAIQSQQRQQQALAAQQLQQAYAMMGQDQSGSDLTGLLQGQ